MSDQDSHEPAAAAPSRDDVSPAGVPSETAPAETDSRPETDPAAALLPLADISDALLTEVRELRELEEKKRHTIISTPEFHRLAKEVENRALRIWDIANRERLLADGTETQPGTTTADVIEANDAGETPDDGRGALRDDRTG